MPYTRVNWENYPSTSTPLNATNLNKMDEGIKNLDNVHENLKKAANNGKLVYVNNGALDTLPPSNLDLHVGSPTVVTSMSEMTDTKKIYIYGDDWYTYDGNEWVDKGPFNEPEIVTDKTLNVSDRPADGKAVGDALATKAEIDGEYERMTVGSAEQLVSDITENDSTAYNFRTAGGSIEIGDRVDETVIGGTVAWNQILDYSNVSSSGTWNGLSLSRTNNKVVLNGTAKANNNLNITYFKLKANHKYALLGVPSGAEADKYAVRFNETSQYFYKDTILNASSTLNTWVQIYVWSAAVLDNVTYELLFFDLTQMFGSTIADYIYSLESATAGAGVAWFKRLFPNPYYAYNEGTLMSVKAGSHITRGFNAWDEEWESGDINWNTGEPIVKTSTTRSKNFIQVVPSTTYYFRYTRPSGVASGAWITYYDADKGWLGYGAVKVDNTTFTTPSDCYYIKFVVNGSSYDSSSEICINLSWDASRDGEYEEYEEHTYTLDNTLELRGIPKLDSSNNLTFDGDKYESDGTVTRRYGIVDLGTLTYTYQALSESRSAFSASISSLKTASGGFDFLPAISSKYLAKRYNDSWVDGDMSYATASGQSIVFINNAYSDVATFKTAMSGVYLVYELAEPTEESAATYAKNQIVNDFGTEEYTDYAYEAGDRDVAIPVGHFSKYQSNLKAKLEMAPDSPSSNGDYVVRHENGMNSYVPLTMQVPTELPDDPTTNGQYYLKLTVQDGVSTLTWESEYSPTV